MKAISFSILSLILLSGCNSDKIYSHKNEIVNGMWKYSDSLQYTFEITDTSQLYTMILNVTHDNDLPYENCYVRINSIYPDKSRKTDILSLEFADKSGTWMGKKTGENYLAPIALQPIAKFKEAGTYKMVFYQNSRIDSLRGIQSLELEINKKKD